MTAAKFTPGKWAVEVMPSGRVTVTAGQLFVAGDENATGLDVDDARLIAAAPALLEVLRPFANYACSPPGTCECHNCRARDVVAAATGASA